MKKKILACMLAVGMLLSGCAGAQNEAGVSSVQDSPAAASSMVEAGESSSESGERPQALEEASASSEIPSSEIPSASGDVFAMDTYMTISCYGDACEEALAACVAEIERLDALLSTGSEDSEVTKINENGGGTLSEDTNTIVQEALSLYESTNGDFDITVYPLMRLWGFTDQNFRVPSQEEIEETLQRVGADKLSYDAQAKNIRLGEGQGIDLGGIAKGYTSDRLMEIFKAYGLVSGVISLGGNVECYGKKTDGSLWRCGIQDPNDPENMSSLAGVIETADRAVITSGGYERYFKEDGTTYHHILDPATGYPAQSGVLSVSIVSESGLLADGLSTSLFIMGLDEATRYWQENGDDFGFIIMTDDNEMYVTEDLQDSFTTDYPMHVVTKS